MVGAEEMKTYIVLFRGINVGGKNRIPMAGLRELLLELGYSAVSTYIASGNVILRSTEEPDKIRKRIEDALPGRFQIDSESIRVLVLNQNQFQYIIEHKPDSFGEQPELYHYDVIFLLKLDPAHAITTFKPREGVDKIWPGSGVVYSERLSSQRTKSRLNIIIASEEYKSMTIRNWRTTTTLWQLLQRADAAEEKPASA